MKKLIFCTLIIIGFHSCELFKLDNFDAPSETLWGEVVDVATGKRVLTDQSGEGIRVRLRELSWTETPTSAPFDFYCKKEGEFQNTKLFPGFYNVAIDGPFIPLVRLTEQGDTLVDESKYIDIKGGVTKVRFEVEPFLNIEWVDEPANLEGKITCSFKITRGVSPEIFKSKIEPLGGWNDNFMDVISVYLFVSGSPYVGAREGMSENARVIHFPSAESDNKSFNDFFGFDKIITLTTDGVIPGGHTRFVRAAARIRYQTQGISRPNYNEAKRVDVLPRMTIAPLYRNIRFSADGQSAFFGATPIIASFTIDAKVKAWKIEIDQTWLTMNDIGNTVYLFAQQNNTGQPRDATVTIKAEGFEDFKIAVHQMDI